MFPQTRVVPAPSNTLPLVSLAPPPALPSHPFAASVSSVLWLKAGFLLRPCPRTTSLLTLYSLPLWSHLGLCLQLLIMCWWITDRCSSSHLSLSLTLSSSLSLSSSCHLLISFWWLPILSEQVLGSVWHGLTTAPASASVSELRSLSLLLLLPLRSHAASHNTVAVQTTLSVHSTLPFFVGHSYSFLHHCSTLNFPEEAL